MDRLIEQQVREWASKNIGSSFVFRPHQAESICSIIENIINDTEVKTHMIEAPTGSGKSLICIIAAGVLAKYYNKKSYILCSDLYLFSQYENFIRDYKLNFGYLKGQTGNYYCDRNGEDVRNGDCRIAKVPWAKLYDEKSAKNAGFECSRYCTYLFHRKKAQKSDVTLMTYQLYFYMINVVKNTIGNAKPPFPERDVIFCDECHNIPSLVQNQYSPTIRHQVIDKLKELYKYNMRLHEGLFANDEIADLKAIWPMMTDLEKAWETLWNRISNENETNDEALITFNEYVLMIKSFGDTVEQLEEAMAIKKRSSEKMSKEDIAMYKVASWYRNHCCFISDFGTAVNDCGPQYIVKQVNTTINNDDEPEKIVTYNCAKEDYMCYRYLLSTSKNQVLTSATIGMQSAYEDNIGIKYMDTKTRMDVIPSTFDFTNSPVLVYSKYKMSYNEKERSLPEIKNMIYQIIRAFKGKRGMIQTGSYETAQIIYKDAPYDIKPRLQLYNNSQEKSWMIEMHKATDDSVIIGPTLVEGVDLPGDLLRFIIIAKVPYPNLQDKLVKAKMNLFPQWYQSETANSIIQGIGRGNRFVEDWCVTYIIDGCFDNLYRQTRTQFPIELQKRIRAI